MADRRVFLNLAGTYIDTALICFAKQKGDNQVVIQHSRNVRGRYVGKDYCFKLCAQ